MDLATPLNRLTPQQRSALYDQAKRQAAELRREAMRDFAAALAAATRTLWRAALHALAARRPQEVPACPR